MTRKRPKTPTQAATALKLNNALDISNPPEYTRRSPQVQIEEHVIQQRAQLREKRAMAAKMKMEHFAAAKHTRMERLRERIEAAFPIPERRHVIRHQLARIEVTHPADSKRSTCEQSPPMTMSVRSRKASIGDDECRPEEANTPVQPSDDVPGVDAEPESPLKAPGGSDSDEEGRVYHLSNDCAACLRFLRVLEDLDSNDTDDESVYYSS
jgi:hypothetical protein